MNEIPDYDVEEITLKNYIVEIKKIILYNLKKYTKLKVFDCNNCNLTKLPDLPKSLEQFLCYQNQLRKLPNLPNSLKYLYCDDNKLIKLPNLPNSLIKLFCHNNNLTELPDLPDTLTYLDCANNSLHLTYHDLKIKTINQINTKNKAIKKMKLLDRILLLEHSARICLNPKRIQRLLNTNEINFFDGSFDNLTH